VLDEEEMYELLAAAVIMHMKRERINRSFLNQERYVRRIGYSPGSGVETG